MLLVNGPENAKISPTKNPEASKFCCADCRPDDVTWLKSEGRGSDMFDDLIINVSKFFEDRVSVPVEHPCNLEYRESTDDGMYDPEGQG